MKTKISSILYHNVKNLLENMYPKGFYYVGKRIIVEIYE